jgi:acyl carrier protein
MKDSIKQFVIRLIEKNDKIPENANIDTFNFIDSGYVDSMGLIKFIVDIEACYDIEIGDSDIELPEFKTVGGLVAIIEKKIIGKNG